MKILWWFIFTWLIGGNIILAQEINNGSLVTTNSAGQITQTTILVDETQTIYLQLFDSMKVYFKDSLIPYQGNIFAPIVIENSNNSPIVRYKPLVSFEIIGDGPDTLLFTDNFAGKTVKNDAGKTQSPSQPQYPAYIVYEISKDQGTNINLWKQKGNSWKSIGGIVTEGEEANVFSVVIPETGVYVIFNESPPLLKITNNQEPLDSEDLLSAAPKSETSDPGNIGNTDDNFGSLNPTNAGISNNNLNSPGLAEDVFDPSLYNQHNEFEVPSVSTTDNPTYQNIPTVTYETTPPVIITGNDNQSLGVSPSEQYKALSSILGRPRARYNPQQDAAYQEYLKGLNQYSRATNDDGSTAPKLGGNPDLSNVTPPQEIPLLPSTGFDQDKKNIWRSMLGGAILSVLIVFVWYQLRVFARL